ncbi:MAG: DUF434 domain-containing protein [Pirellulaceae bacterium]
MTHQQRHRGSHPKDDELFSDANIPKLRHALRDFCWLLTNGYAVPSSLKLVGDKFQLTDRQRMLLRRSACSDTQRQQRQANLKSASSVAGCDIYVDGFNILIAIESALSNGFLFMGQDGCYRDLASVHGTYKRVQETQEAIKLIGLTLQEIQSSRIIWLLDQPVSNSGRLRKVMTKVSQQHGWDWQVELVPSPDYELKQANGIVVTTDSVILDSVDAWLHLNRHVIDACVPQVRLIDLRT